jgi:hypothetical protein
MTDEPKLNLTIEDMPLEMVRHYVTHYTHPTIRKAARKALEKYEAESKPYYVRQGYEDRGWEVLRRDRPGVDYVIARFYAGNQSDPDAEAAARKHAAELNGETTEPEKWWVKAKRPDTGQVVDVIGPFESRHLGERVRGYIERTGGRYDLRVERDAP